MKTLMILAAVASAALATAACGTTAKPTVTAAATTTPTWNKTAEAKPFDTARAECWAETQGTARKGDFERCMAARGWTQG